MVKCIAVAGIVLSAVFLVRGQSPAFEVASIKPSDPSRPIAINRSGYHLSTTSTSLLFLITWAYDIQSDHVYGQPKWLDSVRYDVVANASEDTRRAPARPLRNGPTVLQQMMQSLLAERFKLAVHREVKELPVYVLTVAKNGAKFQLAEEPEKFGLNPFNMPGRGRLAGTQVTAAMLAKVLSGQLGRTVQDQTGLKGVFDFKLEWEPDPGSPNAGSAPSLFTALEEQLGLKLESERGAVDVLVIDHVERPTPD
jgi:uncharacterized protein (TIGR03435 family)